MSTDLYKEKGSGYFNQIRFDFIGLLKRIELNAFDSVLDVGCGSCDTLVYIKEQGIAKKADGIELCSIPNSNQQNKLVDNLHIGMVDNIIDNISNKYDLITFLDVLEHVTDPWLIVKKSSRLLNENGIIIICCPNIREIKTLAKIFFKGTFKYEDAGILDKTHLRFFCPKDLIGLIPEQEFDLVGLFPNYKMAPNRKKAKFLHGGLLDELMAPQYFVVAKKKLKELQ